MVLSNKKLKQKLRSLVADPIADPTPTKSHKDSSKPDTNDELQSIKELLSSKSRKKPKSPGKKRKKKQHLVENSKDGEGSEETQKGNEGEESEKRKREDEDIELMERRKRKKEKKEEKKERKKKERAMEEEEEEEEEKNEKGSEVFDTARNEKKVEEPIKIDDRETKKLYAGGIPYYSSEDDIRSFFEGCGTVTEMDCMTFPETGKFRGIAILTFKTEAAAKRALDLDGADMGGFYLKIQPYKPQRTQTPKPDFTPQVMDGYNRAYVGNLSWDITEGDLKNLFSDCKITSIRFGTDKETGDFKGYAHVDFSDSVSLTIALKLDQKVVCGRPVRINRAVPPKKAADGSLKIKFVGPAKTEDGGTGGGGGSKKKRRTCYECGVPGHLSSACPRKKAAAEVDGSGDKS